MRKAERSESKCVKVNLGCGSQTPEGWVNVDYSLGARLVKVPFFRFVNRTIHLFKVDWNPHILICDIRRRFPFGDNSVDVIYTSHALEHLTKEEGLRFMGECYRVLRPKGIIRILVPDLQAFVNNYIGGNMAADEFVEKLGVGYYGSTNGFF